jgi:hypothetical protein
VLSVGKLSRSFFTIERPVLSFSCFLISWWQLTHRQPCAISTKAAQEEEMPTVSGAEAEARIRSEGRGVDAPIHAQSELISPVLKLLLSAC